MVNFGIIGCGKIGKRHINFLKEMGGVRVLGVADIIEERANKAASICGAQAFNDYQMLLDNPAIDIVNVCTPNGLHAPISIDALNSGKHVLCEKPLCLKVEEADKMIEASKRNNKKLFVVKQNRFNKPIQILKEAIETERFGKIYSMSCNVIWNRHNGYYTEEPWRGTKELDGGALATQASHFLDIMQWIGGNVKSVFAKQDTYTHDIDVEDTGALILRFVSGAIGTMYYTTCAYNKNIEGSIIVLGTRGSAKIGGEYLNKIDYWNVEGYPLLEEGSEKAPQNDYGNYRGSSSKHNVVLRETIKKIIGDESASVIDAIEGKKTVEIIEAAKLSSEIGKEILLPLEREN